MALLVLGLRHWTSNGGRLARATVLDRTSGLAGSMIVMISEQEVALRMKWVGRPWSGTKTVQRMSVLLLSRLMMEVYLRPLSTWKAKVQSTVLWGLLHLMVEVRSSVLPRW